MLVAKNSGCYFNLGKTIDIRRLSLEGFTCSPRPVNWSITQGKRHIAIAAIVIEPPYHVDNVGFNLSTSETKTRRHSKRSNRDTILDDRGLICNSLAARELAFSILYAARLSGERPTRVFRQRLKQTTVENFEKGLIESYRLTSENEDSIFVEDARAAKRLEEAQREESIVEAAVLSAPPSLVYSKSVLKLAQEIIQVTTDSWKKQEVILKDLLPERWQESGDSAAIQICVLHMAMAEMTKMGTPPKIAVNEAVELSKRYTYGRAYRIVNGCLRKFTESSYFKEYRKINEEEISDEDDKSVTV